MTGEACALVPAKAFGRAKSRLSKVLTAAGREQLARDMLAHVLFVLRTTRRVGQIAVVTDCDRIAHQARQAGALVLHDPTRAMVPGGAHLGRVIDVGLAGLSDRGARHGLVIMGDLPWLTEDDVIALLDGMDDERAVIAPDRLGQGTNALGMSLIAPPQTCFGHPDSLQRHMACFAALGRPITRVERPGLAFDVDTPADLAHLRD